MMFLTATTVDISGLILDWKDICMRLLCALLVGLVIGTEREYTHRPAGMRTHILVALGACAVMITGQLIFTQYRPYGSTADPARLAAQVITGVGFLGAGTILREGINVKGLTTAASLWSVACLGIAAGGGYYAVSLIGMVFIFITLTFFEQIQNKLIKPKPARNYALDADDAVAALHTINTLAEKNRCTISGLRIEHSKTGCHITFHGEFARNKKYPAQFFEGLAHNDNIHVATIVEDMVGSH